jgi:hypothetical protein
LWGFTDVPGKAAFSRVFTFLSEQDLLEKTLERIAAMPHKGLAAYHVNRDLTRYRQGRKP